MEPELRYFKDSNTIRYHKVLKFGDIWRKIKMLPPSIMTSRVRRAHLAMADDRAMEEQNERENPVNPKELLHNRNEDNRRLHGAGATPSMGLSEYRGGGTKMGQVRKTARLAYMPKTTATMGGRTRKMSEPHMMGHHLGAHLMDLHGGAFHGDFLKGMEASREMDLRANPGRHTTRPPLLSGRQHGKKTKMEGAGTGAGMLEEPMPIPGTNLSLSGGANTGAYEGQGETRAQKNRRVLAERKANGTKVESRYNYTGPGANVPTVQPSRSKYKYTGPGYAGPDSVGTEQHYGLSPADLARNARWEQEARDEHSREQERINNSVSPAMRWFNDYVAKPATTGLASVGDWVADHPEITSKVGVPSFINKGLDLSRNLRNEGKFSFDKPAGSGRRRGGSKKEKDAVQAMLGLADGSKGEPLPHPSLKPPPGISPVGYVPSSLHMAKPPHHPPPKKGKGTGGGRSARASIVKRVMAEKGLKMIEASKYVKEHNLY